MGYIIALVFLVVLVPIIFMALSRRSTGGGGIESRSRGVTMEEPSSDQPTPGASTVNRPAARQADRRTPPA